MFQYKRSLTFSEFFTKYYDTTVEEPFAGRFEAESKGGNREGMIKVLIDIPKMQDVKLAEKFSGKDDAKAGKLYDKYRELVKESGSEENEACNILVEALFAASASSRLFLTALLDCARLCQDLKAFAKCLRYCECMLELPASFYNKTVENAGYFLECKKECIRLKSECSKQLKSTSFARKKGHRSNKGVCNFEKSFLGKHATMPVVDGKQNRFLESCSDGVALSFDEEKGRHLVAMRNIKVGSVLIVDEPFSFSTDDDALIRNCLHCHITLKFNDSARIPCRHCQRVSFCSEECRREAWLKYHRYECPVLDMFFENASKQQRRQPSHLLLAYRTTIQEALSTNKRNHTEDELFLSNVFLQYHTGSNDCKNEEVKHTNKIYSSQDYCTVLQLETHCKDVDPGTNLVNAIDAIFLAKCFILVLSKMDVICSKDILVPLAVAMFHHLQAINCNAYEIVENVRDEKSRVWEPRNVGGAIYPTVSLVNHSCYPNVVRHSYPNGVVVVRATRFIKKGSEILDCYGPQFLNEGRLTRREYLWKKYRFLCACDACTQNWQMPESEQNNYKCRACLNPFDASLLNKGEQSKVATIRCSKCHEQVNYKKLEQQVRKSIEKRINAISKMYDGLYEVALPLLLEHLQFIEKILVAPNIETIKTQQCIIQCYNYFGCTSQ